MPICIICEKETSKESIINKYDVFFCSEQCLQQYEEKLKQLEQVTDWDNCC